MKYPIFTSILLCQAIIFSEPGIGQVQSQIVETILLQQADEQLKIGWIVAPNTVLIKGRYETIHIYGYGDPKTCSYQKSLSSFEQDNLRYFLRIACDMDSIYHLYKINSEDPEFAFEGQEFSYQQPISRHIVFYASKPISGIRNLGFTMTPIRWLSKQAIKVRSRKQSPDALKYSLHSLMTADSAYVFDMRFYYDRTSTKMTKMEIVLNQVGKNLAFDKTLDLIWKPVCEECGLAVHHDGREARYGFLGGFAVSDLALPLLVFNTSNFHEQAISFTTFLEDGNFEEYRIIENMMDCLEQ